MTKLNRYIFLIITFVLLFSTSETFSQTINTKFGKNRVQYSNDFNNWWLYDTDNYSIFWYTSEFHLAKSVIKLSQISYSDIEELLDFKINKRIKLIIYSDISDFNQSNFGIRDDLQTNNSGTSKILDNKVVVYFDGDFAHLLYQIREGTAMIFINNMFSNLSFENVYNNLISIKVPDWFIQGSAAYISSNWDIISDAELREYFLNKKKIKHNFKDLVLKKPTLAGKSFLYFLEKKYNNISDFFYLERISRNLNLSLQNTTGKSIDILFSEWSDFYYGIYSNEFSTSKIETTFKLGVNNNKNIIYPNIKIDQNNKYLVYSTNYLGKKNIFIVDLKSNKTKKIYSSGYINRDQISDLNYPLFNFYPNSKKLAIIYKKEGASFLRIINLKNQKVTYDKSLPLRLKSVLSFDIWDNKNIVLSAIVYGKTDLFLYNISKRKIKQLTNDYWIYRDIKSTIYQNKRGIIFASNRLISKSLKESYDTILPPFKFDLFFMQISDKSLQNLTTTSNVNERMPNLIENKLVYLSDETGITNIKIKSIIDTSSNYLTNNNFSIISTSTNQNSIYISENRLCYNSINLLPLNDLLQYKPQLSHFKRSTHNKALKSKKVTQITKFEIDKGLLFQSKFDDKTQTKSTFLSSEKNRKIDKIKIKRYLPSHAIASRLRFSFSKFTTRLDNNPLFDGMSIYTEDEANYIPPKAGILSKVLIKDMFEDYFIETGLRISPDFNEKEYFTVFDNLKHRVDWQYVYYRKTNKRYKYIRPYVIDKFKNVTNLFRIKAKYPFNIYKSISLASNLRIDENAIFASDTISLNENSSTEQRFSLKLEYIFDNTSKLETNLLEGNRSKAFIEFYNKFNLNINNSSKFNLSQGTMLVLGYDIRQYFKVLKYSIIALRAAGQTSFGSESNIYFLGGVENWQFSKYSNTTQNIPNENIAFKILAANLRGFGYNAKSGSSFSLFSSEFRIPIFKYIFNTNKKFFRDFQLNFFFDAGLTWNGISPFSKENTSNIKYIDIPPTIKLKLKYYSDPLIAGYGFGVRSSLFGYFLKLDYGWGLETRTITKPILYFSIGHDF